MNIINSCNGFSSFPDDNTGTTSKGEISMIEQSCPKCGKQVKYFKKGVCESCYRKSLSPNLVHCKRCGELKRHQSFGLCTGCYNSIFYIEHVKRHNQKKYHFIDPTMYEMLTKKCAICGFDLRVELHHLDGNHKNFSIKNLVGLCPNHHAMAEDRRWKFEIYDQLSDRYDIPDTPKNRFDRATLEFKGDREKILQYIKQIEK